ncbi:DNA translocase FtsK [Pseudogracilibacillus sp. ICA-222130]|uniref:DNA translocase FtsK n=1 Tax=Pseudogracilibacillus sp. ICA-222130 TaxID=3134655 RepID=UPI0030BE93BF
MWENWKKRVSNIFFREVEVEEYVEIEEETPKQNGTNHSTHRRNVTMDQHLQEDVKVMYQYPKNNHTFPFPVIPDEGEEKGERASSKRTRKTETNGTKRPTHMRTQQRKKRNISERTLQEVPAYMRRRTDRVPHKEELVQHSENEVEQVEEVNKIDLSKHTRHEELDRIFNRRTVEQEQEKKSAEQPVFPVKETIEPLQEERAKQITDEQDEMPAVETSSMMEGRTMDKEAPSVLEEVEEKVEYELPVEKDPPMIEPIQQETIATPSFAQRTEANSIEAHKTVTSSVQKPYKAVPDYLLNDPMEEEENDEDWVIEQQILLEQTLEHFNIDAKVVHITQGPAVTRFEIQPALGVKVSRIRNLADDFKLNMAAKDIRIEAPIPGKNTIGIEVPNRIPKIVTLQQLIETKQFKEKTSPLSIALGLTIDGEPLITDVGKMPHGLIAGATGSGKSVCINTILLSLLYKANYEEVKFLLIDPKMVELAPYNGIPHLISPVITDVKAATMALKWAVKEMDSRYERFVEAGVRNITKYNEKMIQQGKDDEKMPFIVIVIDELADLMMMSPQDVEDAICRIAQKARACGIHLLIATQRPSVDVITGLIKANIPTRIAFSVSSQVDSRTMLDSVGAEKLLGKGDMLFVENGANKSVRLQGPFVSDEEVDRVATYMRTIAEPNYLFEQEQLLLDVEEEEEDELLHEVIHFVVSQNQASTSLLQRRFRIGYNRAARLIDTLEMKGIVSEQNGSKPREVLISTAQLEQ